MVPRVGRGRGDQTFGRCVASSRRAGYCVTSDVGDPAPTCPTTSVEAVSFGRQPAMRKRCVCVSQVDRERVVGWPTSSRGKKKHSYRESPVNKR